MNIRKTRPWLYKITDGRGPDNWGWNRLSDVCELTGQTPGQLFSQFGHLSSTAAKGTLAITDSQQGFVETPIVSLVEYESTLRVSDHPDVAVDEWAKRIFVPAGWVEDVLLSFDTDTLNRLELLDQLETDISFELTLKGYAIHRYGFGVDEESITIDLVHRLKKLEGVRAFQLKVDGGFQTLFVNTNDHEVTTATYGDNYEARRHSLLDNAWFGAASEKVVEGNKAFFIRRHFA